MESLGGGTVAPVHRMVATPETGSRMASGYLAIALTRPKVLVAWSVIVIVAIVFGITQHQLVLAVVFCLVMFPVVALGQYRQNRKNFTGAFPAGSVHTTSFGSNSMTISGPLGASEISYRAFRQLWVRPRVVVVRRRDVSMVNLFPAELFPPEAIALVRRGIESGTPRAQAG